MCGGEMLSSSPAAGRPREASNLPVRCLTRGGLKSSDGSGNVTQRQAAAVEMLHMCRNLQHRPQSSIRV